VTTERVKENHNLQTCFTALAISGPIPSPGNRVARMVPAPEKSLFTKEFPAHNTCCSSCNGDKSNAGQKREEDLEEENDVADDDDEDEF